MYVKPVEGRAPRDPLTMLRILPEGTHAPDHDTSWAVLLRHGDVVEAPDPAIAPADLPDIETDKPLEVADTPSAETAEEHAA